ncbi:MAG: phosphatase PAP2 family protein [bacterium]
MNDQLLDFVNGRLAGRWDLLDDQAVFWAKYGIFVLAAFAGVFGLRELYRRPIRAVNMALLVVAAAVIAMIVLSVSSGLVVEARPFVSDRDTVQLLKHGKDNSFPSDHATLAGLIAVAAALAWPRWAALFLGLGIVVGVSRVVAGVHYPGDVFAGWVIGGGAAAFGWLALRPNAPRFSKISLLRAH